MRVSATTIGALMTLIALSGFTAAWVVGSISSAPTPALVGSPPSDLRAEPVRFESTSGSRLSGWFVPGRPRQGAVILMHGVRANRLEMLGRARFLNRAGFTILLFDFQPSGESAGRSITFGYLESHDAQAALEYVRRRAPSERVGIIGMSMGGAAAILSEPPLTVDALVLEQVFATFDDAVMNRLQIYLGAWGRYLRPALIWQVKQRLDVDPAFLRPVERIGRLSMPLLILAGDADRHATLAENQQLYDRAQAVKELWVIPAAAHVDLHRFATVDYEKRVGAFLTRYLVQP